MKVIVQTDDGRTLIRSELDDDSVLAMLQGHLESGKRGRVLVSSPAEKEPADDEALMTAQDAAEWLGIPLTSFYQAVQDGEIPHLRLGKRRIRVRRSDLLRYMEEGAKRNA